MNDEIVERPNLDCNWKLFIINFRLFPTKKLPNKSQHQISAQIGPINVDRDKRWIYFSVISPATKPDADAKHQLLHRDRQNHKLKSILIKLTLLLGRGIRSTTCSTSDGNKKAIITRLIPLWRNAWFMQHIFASNLRRSLAASDQNKNTRKKWRSEQHHWAKSFRPASALTLNRETTKKNLFVCKVSNRECRWKNIFTRGPWPRPQTWRIA